MKECAFHRGLRTVERDREIAEKHIAKAEHNLQAAVYLDRGGFSDWSVSAFFYCIYHCFLAIIGRFGYESRNQECTIAAIELLKEEGKIEIDDKFIAALKRTEGKEMQESSIIQMREKFQYGTETEFSKKREFDTLVEICKEIINKTKDTVHK